MGKFLRIDQVTAFQPMTNGHNELAPVHQQVIAGDQVIVPQRETTEGDVNSAVGNGLKLLDKGEFHPLKRYAGKQLLHLRQ